MQKVIYKTEIDKYEKYLESTVIGYIEDGQIETYESFENFDLVAFDLYNFSDPEAPPSQILIYIDRDDLFIICEDSEAYNSALKLFTENDSNEYSMYLFFKNLLFGSTTRLEEMEERISKLDDDVSNGAKRVLKDELMDMRNEVLHVKRYYEQLEFLLGEICDQHDGFIKGKYLSYFDTLYNRCTRLVSYSENLRDYLMQVRDSYQAQISIEQNNLMKVFTMVTSIFLPLTLIVGWYGMNLKMPEFKWDYGYLFVICLCVVITSIWYFAFRKKKWI